MNYYKAIIKYNGTGFAGFQFQKNVPTIQEEINKTLEELLKDKVTTTASSRTDSGVHARMQMLRICTPADFDCDVYLRKINEKISPQIKFETLKKTQWSYKPGLCAKTKEYRYFFTNLKINHHESDFIANTAYNLDMDLLYKCCALLCGEHDFINFSSTGSGVKSSIRTIQSCEIKAINPQEEFQENTFFQIPKEITSCFELRIVGNGFLKQMIRHIVGALWKVASLKMSYEEFKELLDATKIQKQLWRVAPAKGLVLYKINEG